MLIFILLSFEAPKPGNVAHVRVVLDETLRSVSLRELSKEESSSLSTSIRSPADG